MRDASIDDIVLGVDTAAPPGLVVNELVSNALEHAFPPRNLKVGGIVRVGLRAMDADWLALTVRDDGARLPPTLQLDGTTRLDRRSGTRLTITFPVHGRAEPNGETE